MGLLKKLGRELEKVGKQVDKAVTQKIKKEAERGHERIKRETKRVIEQIDKEVGVDLSPIANTIFLPIGVLDDVASGKNLAEAIEGRTHEAIEAVGEVVGILGEDAENVAETIAAISALPILIVTSTGDDVTQVIEGDENIEDLTGSFLKTFIDQAHAAYSNYALPIPNNIRLVMAEFFDKDVLSRARYVVDKSATNIAGIANNLNAEYFDRHHAVTLDDIIVFSKAPAQDPTGYAWWAHELHHVQQYKEMGRLKFARRYTLDFGEIEDVAEIVEKKVFDTLSARLS